MLPFPWFGNASSSPSILLTGTLLQMHGVVLEQRINLKQVAN